MGALVPVESSNFAAITDPAEVAGLLRAIDGYQCELVTQFALKIRRSCSFDRASCAKRSGRRSISTVRFGEFPGRG